MFWFWFAILFYISWLYVADYTGNPNGEQNAVVLENVNWNARSNIS